MQKMFDTLAHAKITEIIDEVWIYCMSSKSIYI